MQIHQNVLKIREFLWYTIRKHPKTFSENSNLRPVGVSTLTLPGSFFVALKQMVLGIFTAILILRIVKY